MTRLDPIALYSHIEKDYIESFQSPSEHIDDFLKLLKSETSILDVGCGPGVDLHYMSEAGYNVTGLDIANNMVEQARLTCPGVIVRQGDLRRIPFEDKSFDGLVSSYSIIHLQKKELPDAFQEFCRVLKKDGLLFLSFQGGDAEEKWEQEPFDPLVEFFLNVCSKEEVSDLLQAAGFTLLHTFERPFECKEELSYSKICMIAQKIKQGADA